MLFGPYDPSLGGDVLQPNMFNPYGMPLGNGGQIGPTGPQVLSPVPGGGYMVPVGYGGNYQPANTGTSIPTSVGQFTGPQVATTNPAGTVSVGHGSLPPGYGVTAPYSPANFPNTQGGAMGGDLNGLSDSQLMDLARMFGIDTSFMGGGNISIDPEVRANVSRAFQSQRDLGNQELYRGAIEAAGARGLNLSDTPIGDPYLRNRALFESQLRGNEAASLLGLSEGRFNTNEQTRRFQSEQGRMRDTQRQNFMSGLLNFQQALQQQAFQNRLALAGQGGTTTTVRAGGGVNPSAIGAGIGAIGSGLGGLNLGGIFDWASGLFGGGSQNDSSFADTFDFF